MNTPSCKLNEDFFINCEEEIMKIAQPIKSETGYIQFHNFSKIYSDKFLNFGAHPEWREHFHNKYVFQKNNTTKRLIPGVNYWKYNTSKEISEIAEDARTNFDIDARIEFVWRDDVNDCYNLYSFYSSCKNADKAYRFYDIYRNKLLKFIVYFNKAAAYLITEGDKPENRIKFPEYKIPLIKPYFRNYAAELVLENASLELTNREFEITLLYASGCTLKQIAQMLNNSPRTIEHYMSHIYGKTGCRDRRDLNKYIRVNGWQDLVEFFFSYIPQEKD